MIVEQKCNVYRVTTIPALPASGKDRRIYSRNEHDVEEDGADKPEEELDHDERDGQNGTDIDLPMSQRVTSGD